MGLSAARTAAPKVVPLHPSQAIHDGDLVHRILRGEEWAQRELVRRYGSHVTGVIANILGVCSDIQDLAQESFLIAFRDLAKLRQGTALKAWLTRIAVSRAHNALRSRRRKRWLQFRSFDEVPEVITVPEDEAAVRAVYETMNRLSPNHRVCFGLRYIAGMKLEEVADATGVSLATAKRRVRASRAHFDSLARNDPRLTPWIDPEGPS